MNNDIPSKFNNGLDLLLRLSIRFPSRQKVCKMSVSLRVVGIYCNLTLSDAEYAALVERVPQPKVRDIMDELSRLNPEFQFEGDDDISPGFNRENSTLYSAKYTVLSPGTVSGSGRPIPVDTYRLIDSFDNSNAVIYHEFQYYIKRPLPTGGSEDVSASGNFIAFGSSSGETVRNGDRIIWRMVSINVPKVGPHPLKTRAKMRLAGLRMGPF
jgi:hypothetical protein